MDTGHGATITFGTQPKVYNRRKIGAVEQAREEVEANYLAIVAVGSNPAYGQNLPGDLVDPVEFESEYASDSEYAFDSEDGQPA